MARVEVGSTDDLKELITSQPLSVTKGSGLAAVVAAVLLPLSTALGWFDGEPASVVIAAMALVAIAFVVTGYVIVTDQRVRSELTIESKRLAVQSSSGTEGSNRSGNGAGDHEVVRVFELRPNGEMVEIS